MKKNNKTETLLQARNLKGLSKKYMQICELTKVPCSPYRFVLIYRPVIGTVYTDIRTYDTVECTDRLVCTVHPDPLSD